MFTNSILSAVLVAIHQRNIERLRFGSGVATVLTLAWTPMLFLFFKPISVVVVVIETVAPLIFALAWIGLSKLAIQFYDGRTVPPRNRPEKN
ncbi:MAG: hypothetical protein V7K57_17725 [Nostoc sp.]|uniref:hypothetical protein n=1 Tax=Nostoc sp. TaxID=1180 RepID=UPI002FF802F4